MNIATMSQVETLLVAPRPVAVLFISQSLPPVSDVLFQQLTLRDLIRVSWICRGGRDAIHNYTRRAYSINRLLSRFFDDPLAFRALQARTETLISGSQALQFFCRTYWPSSDLDLYISRDVLSQGYPGLHILELGRWIQQQGYSFTPHQYQSPHFEVAVAAFDLDETDEPRVWDQQNPADVKAEQLYSIPGISAILAFEKHLPDSADTRKIQIIVARWSPIEVILKFHSTAVMNFISWNKAYSLYPYATLEKSRSLMCFVPNERSSRYGRAIIKYQNRGFHTVADVYAHEDPRCGFGLRRRFVGDKDACVMTLDTEGIEWSSPESHLQASSPSFDPYLSNGWQLSRVRNDLQDDNGQHWRRPSSYIQMNVTKLFSTVLRHQYTASAAFVDYVIEFLVSQGTLEHAKLNSSDAILYAGRFRKKPSYWNFYDEELQQIIRQWIRDGMPVDPPVL